MNQSNFWTDFYINFIRNPRKTLEPPVEENRLCWIHRRHSCPFAAFSPPLVTAEPEAAPTPASPQAAKLGL